MYYAWPKNSSNLSQLKSFTHAHILLLYVHTKLYKCAAYKSFIHGLWNKKMKGRGGGEERIWIFSLQRVLCQVLVSESVKCLPIVQSRITSTIHYDTEVTGMNITIQYVFMLLTRKEHSLGSRLSLILTGKVDIDGMKILDGEIFSVIISGRW